MLSLQEYDTEAVRDREAREHGRSLLAALTELQGALLGAEPGNVLARLARLSGSLPCARDPRLRALLRSVQLRAEVELARRSA